jgi:hypothetical protein
VEAADANEVVPVARRLYQHATLFWMRVQRARLALAIWEVRFALAWNRRARARLERLVKHCHD